MCVYDSEYTWFELILKVSGKINQNQVKKLRYDVLLTKQLKPLEEICMPNVRATELMRGIIVHGRLLICHPTLTPTTYFIEYGVLP